MAFGRTAPNPEMSAFDHRSVQASTPGALSRRSAGSSLPPRNFRVAHQKVQLDVDLEHRSIAGHTELTVHAHEGLLKHILLDARQLEVHSVLVNGRRARFEHSDPLRDECNGNGTRFTDAEQHHLYKHRLRKMYRGEDTEELLIHVPDALRLQVQESVNAQNTPNGYRDSPGSHRAISTHQEIAYRPLTVSIDFTLRNPQTGVHFVGGRDSPLARSEWHAYTTNSAIGVSTSSWVPCIDNLWEKPTWEVIVSVPKTVRQIGVSRLISADVFVAGQEDEGEDDDADDSTELTVVGSDFSTQTESPHPVDLAKKLVTFQVPAPTSAHHIGWAVGPFVQTPLINLEEENQPEAVQEKDTTAVPAAVYCLPSQVHDAVNSTIFLYKAIDFYSREFGSYPYTSYGMVFVSDMDVEVSLFGGFSVMNSKLLYPPTAIEPIFDTTYALSVALAEQWSGIYLVPRTFNDIWTTIGIAHFMTLQFIKSLMGVNEYKYRVKQQSDRICDEDIGKPPLAAPYFRYPISMADLDFIKLKAPVVMFILDRRMTKTDKSFGLTRVIPKLFVQAMSGDLPNGCLTTQHFQHVCEKVGHNKLESFFRQWVHGCGVPIFRVSQRFNKKRMFIEMGIRQVQNQETEKKHPDASTFINEATRELEDLDSSYQPSLFTGPMTIRIHEADGTPYEHIVDLKEGFTKLDIQYNTKYKRLKRSQKQIKSEKEAKENADEDETVLLHCLGDILQTEKETKEWSLTDWSKEEEDKMTNEAFEWIRVDADFEWICKIHLNQPDYMYSSQLQQDRDVEAQVESIHYFANSNPSPLYSSILLRTLMDSRYYYGVRAEAALGLAKFAKEQVGFIGSRHLLKAFKKNYCFDNSNIPLPNDFSDFPQYLIKKAIITSLSTVRDSTGNCPLEIKRFLLDLLRMNQNLHNPFSDSYYLSLILDRIGDVLLANQLVDNVSHLTDADKKFLQDAAAEITRYQKMDEWVPNAGSLVGVTAVKNKLRLSRRGLLKITPEELLSRTKPACPDDVRILSFEGLFHMGALKNETILNYFYLSTIFTKSLYLKQGLIKAFIKSLGSAVVDGCGIDLDEDELTKEIQVDEAPEKQDSGFIVVEEDGGNKAAFETRRDAAARATLTGAIELLRRDYSDYEPLRQMVWSAVRSPLLSIAQKRDLFDVLFVLVQPYNSLMVSFETPRFKKLHAYNVGAGRITIKMRSVLTLGLTKLQKQAAAIATTDSSVHKGHQKTKPVPRLSFKPSVHASSTSTSRFKSEVKRSDSGPLRFVKINTRTKNIIVSSDPLQVSKTVTLKLSKEKLRAVTIKNEIKQEAVKPKLTFKAPIMQPIAAPAHPTAANHQPSAQPSVHAKSEPAAAPKPKLKLKFKF